MTHVGQPITVSMCGADSFVVCGQYYRQSVEVFDREAGLPVSSSVHLLKLQACDFTGERFPRAGDEVIVEGMKFRIASAPESDGVVVSMRLHIDDCERFHEPAFEVY